MAYRKFNSLLDRIMDKVEMVTESGCWLWTARLDDGGYGLIGFYDPIAYHNSGKKSVQKRAHVAAYELLIGTIPSGMELDHVCRVRCCVNPYHLEPVTHAENVRRGISGIVNGARMRAKTHCPRGHEYSGANLFVTQGGRKCRECQRIADRKRFALHGRRPSTSEKSANQPKKCP